MMEEQLIGLIGSVGFPIAVCLWLLFERGKTMKELTKAITELTILIRTKVK